MSLTSRLIMAAILVVAGIFAIINAFMEYNESEEEKKVLNEKSIKNLTNIQRALAEEYLDDEKHTEPLTLCILRALEAKHKKELYDERQHVIMQEQLKIIKNKEV